MNKLLLCGAVLGLTSVIMGALGDHGFDLSSAKAESFDTAIRYNMLYAVLIVALALAPPEKNGKKPGVIFALGVILFSFSIYASLITSIEELTYITPLGGITIMAGWVILIIKAVKVQIFST